MKALCANCGGPGSRDRELRHNKRQFLGLLQQLRRMDYSNITQTDGITQTFETLKYLSLIALLDLSWMAEFFYKTVPCDVEKIFYLLFKVFVKFY